MVFFNYALRKLNAKIVYYGPGLCGKTTNLQWIHDHFEGGEKGKMVSLATEGDRTIFFDLLPIEIGTIRGMDVTLQLYTVPGQVHYNSTRQLVLRGADGVVFVGDSQRTMRGSNQESLVNLEENLKLQGINIEEFPHVIQFNKRDLGDLMSADEMDSHLNTYDAPIFEGVAVQGIGVQETLEGIVRLVMRSLRERYEAKPAQPQPKSPPATGSWPVNLPSPVGARQAFVPSMPSPASPPPVVPEPNMDEASLETRPPTGGPWGWKPESADAVQVDEPTDVYRTAEPKAEEQESKDFGFVEPKPESWQVDEPTNPQNQDHSAEVTPPAEPQHADIEDTRVSEPPTSEEAESFEPDGPPFEEIDTHTDILIPPSGESDAADEGSEPDLLEPVDEVESENEVGLDELEPEPEDEPADSIPAESVVESAPFPVESPPSAPTAFDRAAPPAEAEIDFGATGQIDPGFEPEPWNSDPRTVEIDPEALPPAVEEAERTGRKSAVDDLVATVLGSPPATKTEESSRTVEAEIEPEAQVATDPSAAEPVVEEVLDDTVQEERSEPLPPEIEETPVHTKTVARRPASRVVVLSDDEPFGVPDVRELASPEEIFSGGGELQPVASPVEVVAEDNSLALKLSGTGALVESGQVRALDIEVPVPGKWVGNRRVTLQLRLTLAPAEDDDDR